MKISKPDKYAKILLDEMIEIIKMAVNNYSTERMTGARHYTDSQERLQCEMKKVDGLKAEIIELFKEI